MSVVGTNVRANMLLCDAAQVVGDKLYILGGGWSYLWLPQPAPPVSFATAVDLALPWEYANRRLNLVMRIVTEDFQEFVPEGADEPVRAEGHVVAGRAPTARPGAALHIPMVIPFAPMQLDQGGYVCELLVDGESVAQAGFQVSFLGTPQEA